METDPLVGATLSQEFTRMIEPFFLFTEEV